MNADFIVDHELFHNSHIEEFAQSLFVSLTVSPAVKADS